MRRLSILVCQALILALTPFEAVRAGEVEVLHFWTSPGEAKSIEEVKRLMAARGHSWKDFAVAGGGGGNAMATLAKRISEGNPPSAATIKGPALQELAAQKVLTNLNVMAQFDHWDKKIPAVVKKHVQFQGNYVAVPVNIHRANWLWINAEVMKKAGVAKPPASIDDLFVAAERIKDAGFVPLAHGGQAWQDFLLFESVAIGVMGIEPYRKTFVDRDSVVENRPQLMAALRAFRKLKAYTDNESKGRSWDATSKMVIEGRAAFQIMGDWAKGEFLVAEKRPGIDFLCVPAPGTSDAFAFVVDTFAMFQLKQWEAQKAQGYLAFVLMGAEFQESFSLRKGSIPARSDVNLGKFDTCAKSSFKDLNVSSAKGYAIPSAAVDMALPTGIKSTVQSIISEFWNTESISESAAAAALIAALDTSGKGARTL